MNSHIPFDADNDWTLDPYHCNRSNDPLVDKVIGNAYAVVRAVYCNLGNLKLLYDFLNTYGMVLGVKSEAELKKLNKLAKYARIYGFADTGDRQVTDYLYVPDDTSGIRPDDPTATGSWIKVSTSSTGGGTNPGGTGSYIPYVYAGGSAVGGETSFKVPSSALGVPFIIVNGSVQYVGYGFEFSAATSTVTLSSPLKQGDEVIALTSAAPANPDNPNVPNWLQINWLYNNGSAMGGEQVITIPYSFTDVPAVYKNGVRYYKNLQTESYTFDPVTRTVTLTEILAQGDRVIVTMGGEAATLSVSDRTIQEIARAYNVKDKDVALSTDTHVVITDKKILYDATKQKSWKLPVLPPNAYIVKVVDDTLTYNPGNVTVNLVDADNFNPILSRMAAEAGLNLVGSFERGAQLTDNTQAIAFKENNTLFVWKGTYPKTVGKNSTPESTGGISSTAWERVDQKTLKSLLASQEGAKLVGSGYGKTVFDDMAAKDNVFPIRNIYPTMTNAKINEMLTAGGSFFVNAGTYTVASSADTWKLGQNSRVYWSPNALLQAGADSVTLLRGSSQDVGSSFIRNCKVYGARLSLVGFNNCIGIKCYDMRNNSEVSDVWIDMGLGTNNLGLLVEHYSYGIRLNDSEIINGGVGSTRIMLRNGVNAVTIKDHMGYSGDHSGPLPDYGIVVFNGLDGAFNFPDGSDLWPTAAVCITGGYSQNTSKYGLLESGVSTYVSGTYFERNAVSDVTLGTGSYYFTSKATHHSLNIGESCFRSQGANHANIGAFNPADRSIGQFNFTGGNNCRADGSKLWGAFLDKIGVVTGLRLDLGEGSVKQYTAETLPIKVREGFRSYRINVTSGMNITVTGSPYDGQVINMLVRGSNIAALSFAGVPVDVTGANTVVTKTAQFTATYWASIGKWTLTMPSWTASS